MKTNKLGFVQNIKITLSSIKLIFINAKLLSVLYLIIEVITSITPFILLIATREITNLLTYGNVTTITVLIPALVFFVSATCFNSIIEPVRSGISETIQDKVAYRTQQTLLDAINKYETTELFEFSTFYNELREAEAGSGPRMISVLQLSTSMVKGIVTIFSSAYLFISINWWVGLITILSIIPTAYYGIWAARNRVRLFRRQSEPARKLAYYKNLSTSREAAKELRLYRMGDHVVNLYKNTYEVEYAKANKVRKKITIVGIIANIISSGVIGFAIVYFVINAISNNVTVGDIILYIGVIPQLASGFRGVMNSYIYMVDNNNYIDFYYKFIKRTGDMKANINTSKYPSFKSLALKNISFAYPGSTRNALDNVSFNIKGPGLVAVVGRNGSGKSTLVKLLLKMYNPTSGNYYVDDIDVNQFDSNTFRAHQSGVFQDFVQMSFSVSDNIWFGNIDKEKNIEKIKEVANAVGAANDINKLPNGYDSLLGKEFLEGEELSRGQWQKLIWSRALYSDANFMIFDEPTSAIDAGTENKLYELILEMSKDKMVFLISHRLSSVIKAKTILVLENGKLIEQGTHKELMEGETLYKSLFDKQASGYVDGED